MDNDIVLSGDIILGDELVLEGDIITAKVIKTPLQSKSITPTKELRVVTPDEGYALSEVIVDPIPHNYIDPNGSLSISQNASGISVREFNTVDVNVPNTYLAEDEGKVVQNGALISQHEDTVIENGIYDTTDISQLTVDVPVPVAVEEKDVNFYDYDGTVVASYTAQEFLALDSMPDNPDRTDEGLTAQGWNWGLANAKTYATDYGRVNIGQMRGTIDGKTHLKIHLDAPWLSPRFAYCIKGEGVIDWGDGYTDDISGTSPTGKQWKTHTYSQPGDYDLTIFVNDGGELQFRETVLSYNSGTSGTDNVAYFITVKKAFIGDRVSVLYGAFNRCSALECVSIPNNLNVHTAFSNCSALKAIIFPSSQTAVQNSVFQNDYSLQVVCVPDSVSSFGTSVFQNNTTLKNVILPSTITALSSALFHTCYMLDFVIIPKNVTSISTSVFYYTQNIRYIKFTSSTPPAVENSNAFSYVRNSCKILVPRGSLNNYKTAQNYPDPSVYTYEEF